METGPVQPSGERERPPLGARSLAIRIGSVWPDSERLRRLAWRPPVTALRHTARTVAAALLAYVVAEGAGLPQAYWAVISAVVVMQGSLGGTLSASIDRLLATVAGAVAGAACFLLATEIPLTPLGRLSVAITPMALLAALRPNFRLAPITATIVVLAAPPHAGLLFAFERVAEIGLGCVIGGLTAQFVLPDRARRAIETNATAILDALGQLAEAHLCGGPAARIDALNDSVNRALNAIATAASEEARERALHLRTGPPAAPMLRTLRRVRSDVAILGRAMLVDPQPNAASAAGAIRGCFDSAASFLRKGGPLPALDAIDRVLESFPPATPLAFGIATLRRDLAELNDRLAEQRSG